MAKKSKLLVGLIILFHLSISFSNDSCLAQGDLNGAVLLSPNYMPELEQYIYRGAITPQPHFNPELYGLLPDTPAWRVGHLQDDLWQWRTIEALTGERRPFILSQGQRSTNPAYQTAEFNYGLTRPTDAPDGSNCRTRNGFIRGLRSEHWAPYWRSVEHLIERGYRPIDSHHFIGLPRGALVMGHIDAPVPGSGAIPTNTAGEIFYNYDPRRPGYYTWLPDGVHGPVAPRDPELTALIMDELHNPGVLEDSYIPLSDANHPLHVDAAKFGMTLPDEVRQGVVDGLPEFDLERPLAPESPNPIDNPQQRPSSRQLLDPAPTVQKIIVASGEGVPATPPAGPPASTGSGSPPPLDGLGSKLSLGNGPPPIDGADLIVVTPDASNPSRVSVKRLPPAMRWLLLDRQVQVRYLRYRGHTMRQRLRGSVRSGLRTRLRSGAVGGGRLLRGIGAGLVFQYGASEGLKATTGMDDDTANMVVMPLSEAVGMIAVDLALPTVGTTTSTAAAGTTAAATTSVGMTVVAGAIGGLAVVTEGTRRSADQHSLKLAYDDSSTEMGTSMTINLMRRNAHLRDSGEISQEEMMRRNKALGDSARREGERTVEEARWIGERYRNGFAACLGTIGDGWSYWTGRLTGGYCTGGN